MVSVQHNTLNELVAWLQFSLPIQNLTVYYNPSEICYQLIFKHNNKTHIFSIKEMDLVPLYISELQFNFISEKIKEMISETEVLSLNSIKQLVGVGHDSE